MRLPLYPPESATSDWTPPALAPERPKQLVGLVDCSAFYCSCERAFDPRLVGVPVAVLSNNDGCVIARTAEVKALGVKMGAPYFQVKRQLAESGVVVKSSNYELYADVSRRVMACLESFTPDPSAGSGQAVEAYSIDEAFVTVPVPRGTDEEARERVEWLASEIRRRVLRWTGVPVRVSFAETKTLAKAASEWARGRLTDGGEPVVCFWGHPERAAFLDGLPVEDVWGVARKWGQRLRDLGGPTAARFAALPDRLVKRHLNVVALRTAYELRGVPCITTDGPVGGRRTLVRSRSFGRPVTEERELKEAVATHAARAAEKLRREGLACRAVGAFVTTRHFGDGPHRSGSRAVSLGQATNRTSDLVRAALLCLRQCHEAADRRGRAYRYRKAGVTVWDLVPESPEQGHLFQAPDPAQAKLYEAIDGLNRRFGKRTVFVGSMGVPSPAASGTETGQAWAMKRERMSPRYTTRWDELVVAFAR